jgi:quercetin dioxygenase-like cupin family protein
MFHFTGATPQSGAMHTNTNINTTTYTPSATEPYFAPQSEARWFGDGLWEFLVPSEVTNGQLSVFRATMPRGFSPPRHIHAREDEVFLVLDGEVCFDLDGRRRLAGPGTSIYMPRGVPHTFCIQSRQGQMLGIMLPGAFEQLFRNLSIPAGERGVPKPGTAPLDVAAVMAEQLRLGTEVVGPPMTLNTSCNGDPSPPNPCRSASVVEVLDDLSGT